MLLSDAMKMGSMLGKQGFGTYYGGDWLEPDHDTTCALGATMEAVGLRANVDALVKLYPGLEKEFIPTLYELARIQFTGKEEWEKGDELMDYIIALNDTGYYSREWIADWLVESGNDCESVEPISVETLSPDLAHTTV